MEGRIWWEQGGLKQKLEEGGDGEGEGGVENGGL